MTKNIFCPIIGCHHYPRDGSGKHFESLPPLIQHLKSDAHINSLHLLDHTLCNKIKLYRCTHNNCSKTKNKFFCSKRALDDHNNIAHNKPHNPQSHCHNHTINSQSPHPSDLLFDNPNNQHLTNNWESGMNYITQNYNHDPPHFRSTWRRFLRGNNHKQFYHMLSKLISCVITSCSTKDSEAFWWLLFHFEMLILAPTPKALRPRNNSIKHIISQRLQDFQCGNTEILLADTKFNNNWNSTSPRPTNKAGNSAAQLAADSDNYRTAITRVCTFNKIATISKTNMKIIHGLYPDPASHTRKPTNTPHTKHPRTPYNININIRN